MVCSAAVHCLKYNTYVVMGYLGTALAFTENLPTPNTIIQTASPSYQHLTAVDKTATDIKKFKDYKQMMMIHRVIG